MKVWVFFKKVRFFFFIVYGDFHGVTIDPKTAWEVVNIVFED